MLENARHHYLIVRYELCCGFDTVTIVRYQGYWVSAPEADLETPERQTAGARLNESQEYTAAPSGR